MNEYQTTSAPKTTPAATTAHEPPKTLLPAPLTGSEVVLLVLLVMLLRVLELNVVGGVVVTGPEPKALEDPTVVSAAGAGGGLAEVKEGMNEASVARVRVPV